MKAAFQSIFNPEMKGLFRHMWVHARLPLALAVAMRIAFAVLPAGTAYAVGRVVGVLGGETAAWQSVWPWAAGLVLLHLAGQAFILNSFKDYWFQCRLEPSADETLLQGISRLPLREFERSELYDKIARVGSPSKRMASILEDALALAGNWLNIACLMLVIGLHVWWLPPLLLLLTIWVSGWEARLGRRMREFESGLTSMNREKGYAGQLLTGRGFKGELQLFGLFPRFRRIWEDWNTRIHTARTRFDLSLVPPQALLIGSQSLLLLAALLMVVWHARGAGADLAAFAATALALLSLFQAMERVGGSSRSLGEGSAYMREVRELADWLDSTGDEQGELMGVHSGTSGIEWTDADPGMSKKNEPNAEHERGTLDSTYGSKNRSLVAGSGTMPEVTIVGKGGSAGNEGFLKAPGFLNRGIEFVNVSFTYPGESRPALRQVNLFIRAGEKVALVGANGSGKSTLVKLLLGLYEPDEGRIVLDGVDIRRYEPRSLRQAMSAVFQDYARFPLTVRENIGFGQADRMSDTARIRDAAAAGGADSFIADYPLQYETPLSRLFPDSVEPSAGQWQKLAISRGLMRRAPIMIMDEPAAALDPIAEAQLYRQYRDLLEGCTAILITHRLGSAKACERMIVLHEGAVAEMGTHEELMARETRYARMFAAQADWYREEIS